MLEPKDVIVDDMESCPHNFIISKMPATVGREVIANYPLSAMPKIGDYAVNEAIMLKMMGYVCAVSKEGHRIPLTTKALVDNHCKDWQVLAKLEIAMLEYNTNFFSSGKVSKALTKLSETVPPLITKILTDLLRQLSQAEKQR